MFGKLAGIFDKDFLVGYFLPALLFMLAALKLAVYFNFVPAAFSTSQNLGENLIFLVLCWLLSLFLLVSNRAVLRTMEGYGKANPMRVFGFLQHRQFQKLTGAKAYRQPAAAQHTPNNA